jgi:arginase
VALAALRPDLSWQRLDIDIPVDIPVDVPAESLLEIKHGIRAYTLLETQLEQACLFLQARQPTTLFTVGGDCGIELAPVSYLNTRHEQLTVVWFDAHADLQAAETSPSGHLQGMPLRLLLGEGNASLRRLLPSFLEPDQVILAGVRALDPAEEELLERWPMRMVSASEINGHPHTISELVRQSGRSNVYLHVDLDVLEPKQFSSLGWPEPDGVTVQSLMDALTHLHDTLNIVGGGLTEYLPKHPDDARTVHHVLNAWLPR